MSISELSMTLERLTRICPQSSDPRVREVLSSLQPHSRELLVSPSSNATVYFRRIGSSLIRLRGGGNAALRLGLLYDCCHHLYLMGCTIESIRLAECGLDLAKRAGNPSDLRRFMSIIGITSAEIGDRGRGVEYHTRALALSTTLQDRQGEHISWSNLSVVFVDSGLYSEAIACSNRALDLVGPEDTDADDNRARALNNSALALLLLGETIRAEAFARRALDLSVEPRSHQSAVVRLVRELNLIMVLVANKKYSLAETHARYVQTLASRFPSPRTQGTANLCDGLVTVYRGDSEAGLAKVESVAATLKGVMIPLYLDSLSLLARLYGDLDRPEDALRVLREFLSQSKLVISESFARQLLALGVRGNPLVSGEKFNQIEHAKLESELRARVAEREVSRSRQEMLERMAVAADIREDISGEHGYRVGRLSALLAKEIGWDRDACNAIDIAARLHDIGKIGIPEKILLDEKTLKEAEKHFIASHTLVGAEILSKSDIPQVRIAEEIARCHHEWWDGSGYPRQLKGLDIPRVARIVALADAFDAMTHGRPYALAISIPEALDQISGLRGRQFDPELTDYFLALVRRLAAANEDLDAYLGKAARNSPFLRARAKIKELLAQGRDSTALSPSPPPPGTPLN